MENRHAIRKQELRIDVDSEETALALHSHMPDINRRYLLPVIESVLSEMAPAARHIRIPRVRIDLGAIPLNSLAETAGERLQLQLREVLEKILSQTEEGAEGFRSHSPEAARLEIFEHYLVRGTLPFWASPRDFSPENSVSELAAHRPGELAAVLRDCGSYEHALDRMVRQLADPVLQRLLRVLEPGHAALILAYIFDLKQIYRMKPALDMGESEFSRLVWILVFAYLVQERGSHFNRKSFVKSLLQGMGQSEGLAYEQIVGILCLGLEKTGERLNLNSSLPAIIKDLAQEIETERASSEAASRVRLSRYHEVPDSDADSVRRQVGESSPPLLQTFSRYEMIEGLRYLLCFGVLPWTTLIRCGEQQDAEAFLALLPRLPVFDLKLVFRGASHVRGKMVRRAVRALPEKSIAPLLSRLLGRPLLRESLPDFASRAEDRHAFYARLMLAILENRELTSENFALSGVQEAELTHLLLPQYPVEWKAEELKSILLSSLQADGTRNHNEIPDQHEVLRVLIHRHPDEALHFFALLCRRKHLLERLIHNLPSDLFLPALELVRPDEAGILESIIQSAFTIPIPYRPGSDQDRRRAVLLEALRLERGRQAGEAFFRRVLSRLFDVPLSERVRNCLLETSEVWHTQSSFSPTAIADFEAAVVSMSVTPAEALAHDEGEDLQTFACAGTEPELAIDPQPLFDFLSSACEAASTSGGGRFGTSRDVLHYELLAVIDHFPDQVFEFFKRHSGIAQRRKHWIEVLPESCLARVAGILEPQRFSALLETAEVLIFAWFQTAPRGSLPGERHEVLWDFLFAFLAHHNDAGCSTSRLIEAFFEYVSERSGNGTAVPPRADLLEAAARLAETGGRAGVASQLRPDRQDAGSRSSHKDEAGPGKRLKAEPAVHRRSSRPVHGRTAFGMNGNAEEVEGDVIYLTNAGSVLVSPFLPHLFQTLDMLEKDDERTRLHPGETASRAVHLLQYLVDGSVSRPEPLLVLNKILCGLDVATPVDAEIEMQAHERQICDQLLQAIIGNWKAIENTSVAGLRETFLQREGKIKNWHDNGWQLKVQRKTLDVLVDQIPWSISIIYHRWMAAPIHVTW
jgi:Contractile injection system tape measure protein